MSSALWCVLNGRAPRRRRSSGASGLRPRRTLARRAHADRLEHGGACEERGARFLVGDQMQVAASLLQIGVLQAGPLLREGAEGLRQHRPSRNEDAELALARRADGAGRPDDVAEVHLLEQGEVVGGQAREVDDDLQVPLPIAERREHEFAHVALEHDAARDGDHVVGLRVGGEAGVRDAHGARTRRLGDAEHVGEGDRERMGVAQALEALATSREHLRLPTGRFLRHRCSSRRRGGGLRA